MDPEGGGVRFENPLYPRQYSIRSAISVTLKHFFSRFDSTYLENACRGVISPQLLH